MNTPFVPTDEYLGKFVSAHVLELVLENQSLRWSRPGQFNDPFDCQPQFRFCPPVEDCLPFLHNEIKNCLDGTVRSFSISSPFAKKVNWILTCIKNGTANASSLIEFLETVLTEAYKDSSSIEVRFRDEIVTSLQTAKVLCLTKSFHEILMWSHYADNHKGALLGFAPLVHDSPFSLAKPLTYTNNLPFMMTEEDISKAFTGQISLGDQTQTKNTMGRAVFTKARTWQYENEFRILGGDGFEPTDEYENNMFSAQDLRFVVLGCRAPANLKLICRQAIDGKFPHLRVFDAVKAEGAFGLDFIESNMD